MGQFHIIAILLSSGDNGKIRQKKQFHWNYTVGDPDSAVCGIDCNPTPTDPPHPHHPNRPSFIFFPLCLSLASCSDLSVGLLLNMVRGDEARRLVSSAGEEKNSLLHL